MTADETKFKHDYLANLINYTESHPECLPLLKERMYEDAITTHKTYFSIFSVHFPAQRIEQLESWLIDYFGIGFIQSYDLSKAPKDQRTYCPEATLRNYLIYLSNFTQYYNFENERKIEI